MREHIAELVGTRNREVDQFMRITLPFLLLVSLPLAAQSKMAASLKLPGKTVKQSVKFVRVHDGKVLFEQNAKDLLIPASVTKLITAAAVLERFTPGHHFSTKFYYTGKRKADEIDGDLIVVGDGDPFIVSEQLWQLAADFRNMGIEKISGDLIIDNSLFDKEARDLSREFGLGASVNAYDAPVSAFAVNFNTLALVVSPGLDDGAKGHVAADPYALDNLEIRNTVTTGRITSLRAERVSSMDVGEVLTVKGSIGTQDQPVKIYRSVSQFLWSSGSILRAFLREEGIKINGKVKEGRKKENAVLLYDMQSYDMQRIVSGLNKFSNNFIADVLLKRLGAAYPITGTPDQPGSGSYANGLAVLENFLKTDVKTKSAFFIRNGSGLSEDNRLNAQVICDVLQYMGKNFDLFPEFLASLPAAGWDGTLKERFDRKSGKLIKGLVRAKTGTLSEPVSVSSLAGYLQHPQHGLVAFTIMQNGVAGKPQPSIDSLRQIQEKTLGIFLQQ